MMDQETSEMDISSLPPEIIVHIFGYLNICQRLYTALTCKQWYQLAFSPSFCKKIILRIKARNRLTGFQEKLAYKNCRNADILYDTITDENRKAIADFFRTAPLEYLEIVVHKDSVKTFLDEFLPCMNLLTELCINAYEPTEGNLKIKHPTLKSLSIVSSSGCDIFEVVCPSLDALKIELAGEKCIDFVAQLQQQLQCLELVSFKNHHFATLAIMELNNLKKLNLQINPDNTGLQLSFNQMENLQELHLNDDCYAVTVGEEFGVLKRLSKLSLVRVAVNTVGFGKALRSMVDLSDLHLDKCIFTPSIQPSHFMSDHVRNLSLVSKKDSIVTLPNCMKLRSLTLAHNHNEIDDIFNLVCDLYPELESLNFGVLPGMIGMSLSPASFSHIKKLKLLKNLQFTRLFLHGMDWAVCSDMKIEKLQLEGCAIRGTEALQMVEAFGDGLRQLLIDCCYLQQPRADVFDIDEHCVEGLRKHLPKCRISYYDCHTESLYETCGGRWM